MRDAGRPGCLQEQQGAGGVRVMARDRVGDAARHAAESCQVDDALGAPDRGRQRIGIEQGTAHERIGSPEVLFVAVGKVVDDRDGVPALQREPGQVGPDESGSAGDQHVHVNFPQPDVSPDSAGR